MRHLQPDTRIRILIEGTVQRVRRGEIRLANRTFISFESEDDLTVEIVTARYEPGDIAQYGERRLMRCRTEPRPSWDADAQRWATPEAEADEFWIAADGTRVNDREINPNNLTLLVSRNR
ncbi:hypothetical protein ACFVIM_34140 [Streptomyces sp. NPDC057638]|uniref:hypothetical protein n=1 Tax=Streptomyces sp. NPDC057638 TaxID=3346190 RepID=UPI00367F4222